MLKKKKKRQNNSKLKIYALNLRFQAIVFLFLPNQKLQKGYNPVLPAQQFTETIILN